MGQCKIETINMNGIRYEILVKILFIIVFLHSTKSEKQCTKWTTKFVDHDGPSLVYTESVKPTDGIGTQLSIFGMLWMLRRSYNVDVFISKSCHQTLSRVFTQESLKEIHVLEEYFCNHEDIDFEYFPGSFEEIVKRREFRIWRNLYL